MGEVWRAEHEELHIDVAVKFVGDDALSEVYQERFRFEAQVAAQIGRRSPYVVAVNDAGTHHGRPYLVMELVEGASVDDEVYDRGPLDVSEVQTLLEQVGSAIDAAHEAGIFHRDVKPANILVDRAGDRLRFKLADFGVAKMHAEVLALDRPQTTQQGQVVGTPAYMSPSQFTGGAVDGGIDRWALAVVAYEALTGRLPFDGQTTSAIFSAVLQRRYVPVVDVRPGLPGGLEAWFAKAWAADEQGYPSCRAMADAFAEAVSQPVPTAQGTARAWPPGDAMAATALDTAAMTSAGPTIADEPTEVPVRRSPALIPVAVVGALIGLGLGAWVLSSSADTDAAPPPESTAEAAPSPPEEPQRKERAPEPAAPEPPAPAALPRPSPPPSRTPSPSPKPPEPSPEVAPKTDPVPQPSPPPAPKVVPKDEIL